MATISDNIERFLLKILDGECSVNISRNELANYFACAPSQINYVLSTRFSTDSGFITKSRRGGGGYITLIRLPSDPQCLLRQVINLDPQEGLSYQKACSIVQRMLEEGAIDKQEAGLICAALSDKALLAPGIAKNGLRVGLLKSFAAELLRPKDR